MNKQLPATLRGKQNSSLSEEEREQKRNLKKTLRLQTKVKRLENMMLHAKRRNDPRIELEAKAKLEILMGNSKANEPTDGEGDSTHSLLDPTTSNSNGPLHEYSKKWILQIMDRLFRYENRKHDTMEDLDDRKKLQTQQTLQLLKHMKKGTQDRTMFQEPSALWGYTRQKFLERALLLCTSLGKLQPHLVQMNSCTSSNHTIECIHKVLEWMIAGNIRQACSLGCGPGSDAVGLVAFLQWIGEANLETTSDGSKETCHNINERQACSLERILFFDFAIDDWVQVLEPLKEVLGKKKPETKIHWGYCDVSHPFASVRDGDATLPMYRIEESDIFLISYLLTETRGQWELFFQQLIDCAKPRSIFYFAEPTPWQLHGFKELFQDNFDFIWLDSSMDHPNLQPLDGRIGPAVLLGIKK